MNLDLKSSLHRITVKHFNRIERIFRQIAAEQFQFLEYVSSGRDDVASYALSLDNVEDLTRAGPDEFHMRRFAAQERDRFCHDRHRVYSSIRDAPGKNRNVGGRTFRQAGIACLTCSNVVMAVTLSLIPSLDKRRTSGNAGSAFVLVTGTLT